MTKETKTVKRERTPFNGERKRLSVRNQEDGFHYHWFNDTQDRIQRALAAGYEYVDKKDAGQIGDPDVGNKPDGLDSRVSKRISEKLTCFLMRIPQEFYDSDQKLKQLEADEIDQAIFGGGAKKVVNSYGLDVRFKNSPYSQ
jgi:hypothetical protein